MTILYNKLKEIYLVLDDGDRQFLSRYNLTVPRFFVLKHIGENPGITMTKLSTLMLSDKSNITRLITGLEDEGLVERRRTDNDRRKICLHLTSAGESIFNASTQAHGVFNEQRFSSLNKKMEDLVDDLDRVKNKLSNHLSSFNSHSR
jgi:DNA-binding MarR family transcriptional regulator